MAMQYQGGQQVGKFVTVRYNTGHLGRTPRVVAVSGVLEGETPTHISVRCGGMLRHIHKSRVRSTE